MDTNPTDAFTKSLSQVKFRRHAQAIGMALALGAWRGGDMEKEDSKRLTVKVVTPTSTKGAAASPSAAVQVATCPRRLRTGCAFKITRLLPLPLSPHSPHRPARSALGVQLRLQLRRVHQLRSRRLTQDRNGRKVCECADRKQQVYIDVKKLYADAMDAVKLEPQRARELDGDYVEEQDEDDESYIDAKARLDRNGEDDEVGKGSRSVLPPPLKPPAKPKRKVHVAKKTGAGTKAMTQAAAAAAEHEAAETGSSSEELSSVEDYESPDEEVDDDIAGSDDEYGFKAKRSKSPRTTKAKKTSTASRPSTSNTTTSSRADEDGGEAPYGDTSFRRRISLKHLTPEERRLHKNAVERQRKANKTARNSD
ncbi:hypothetical protein V8E36_008725 [Tilletia maclaganii]